MHLSNTSVAFAAEGGIVAALPIIKRLLARGPADRVLVFYGAPDGEHGEPLEELLALKDRHLDRLSLSFVTSRDAEEAELFTGCLDAPKIGALAAKFFDPHAVREYFVCGPRSLIEAVTGALREIGVEPGRIHASDSTAPPPATAGRGSPAAKPAVSESTPKVAQETRVAFVMDGRRRTFGMLTGEETILDAATRAGVDLPFSCKAGVCSTCRTKLVSGQVELAQNYALEDWELEQGFILACQAHAKTPEIELTYDEK